MNSEQQVPQAILLALIGLLTGGCHAMFTMPGTSYRGDLPPLTAHQQSLADDLRRDVTKLATDIGPRHVYAPAALNNARNWLHGELEAAGYSVTEQTYEADGEAVANLIAELPGTATADRILVIGAHYDSIPGCPAANDNGSGIAALLALARHFADAPQPLTLRFVAFVNEEPPWFHSELMGSYVYAKSCHDRGDDIIGMLALETMGYFDDQPGSQHYPKPVNLLYPDTGNFIAFVGNLSSDKLTRRTIQAFRHHATFPSEAATLPAGIEGAGWSDHWSFWQFGYPAVMVTDTAPFRYPHYHLASDTPDKLDYERFARVVDGLAVTIRDLAADL